MMGMLRSGPGVCLLAVVLFAGCGPGKGDTSPERLAKLAGGSLKAVVPVSGTVLVDGTPQAGVILSLYQEADVGVPVSTCRTGQDGKYCWATHLNCDGLEPGSYRLGFEYIPKPKRNDSGVDVLKGKYKNPMKVDFKLTVEAGSPQTDVDYELKTK